ncbi:fatty acid desaturase [Synechococcus sp. RSCCF101]|uniref:fatty acid desaturase n=1 Tax=Synechococcus sp. RSCCF101 TaxID=2511069 RepID=UPI0012465293|nr:fatty acid desaturase [Synechococcus sp. RSCCF101]QEY31569.1 fatty acid desaturase [Synechococcus sp. RSCCF101]
MDEQQPTERRGPVLLSREQLRDLNAGSDGPAAVRCIAHLLVIGAGGWLWRQPDLPWLIRLPALLLSGIALATCFAPMHECGHRTAFRSQILNDSVAWVCGLLSFYNADFYRRYHQWHHRFTHQPGRDPELDDVVPTSLAAYLLQLSGLPWWAGKVQTHLSLLLGRSAGMPYLPPEALGPVRRSVALQLSLYGLIGAASWWSHTGLLWWNWLLPLALGQPFLRFVLLAEHTGCAYNNDPLANTRTTLTLAPLRWLMWEMPFHAEHHLYPSVPFHALHRLHALVAPRLEHCAPGYLAVHRGLLARLDQLAPPAAAAADPVAPALSRS